MKKVTKKAFGILALVVLSVPAQAGWLSNLGQRIVNGAANTVQTNISGKVNKAVNDVMDGKVGNQKNNSNTGYNKNTSSESIQNTGAPTSVSNKSKTNTIKNQEKLEPVSYKGAKGIIIPSTGNYELIDLGTMQFKGEEVFYDRLNIGVQKLDIDKYLDPGYYLIWVDSVSRTNAINVVYEHESEGIEFGYGIEIRKRIFNSAPRNMIGNKEGIMHVVQVLPKTQGHLELSLINNPQLNGAGTITVYKIPGPELK
ncbi:hypothetical protein AB8B23_09110 [Leptotrichia sp. HSP-342]|uniref:Uncharacterized protein n=1 Tax=Leptotrichia mesophila TaxID=3239303 RepID=A0AB39V8R8_9FUSO